MRITDLFLLLATSFQVSPSVISVDLGTQWVKVGLISINKKFETIMNRDSKRKSLAVVTMRDNVRTYSYNGQALGMRYPKDSFSHLKLLVGKTFNSDVGKAYRAEHYSRTKECPSRKTFLFQSDNGQEYSVEEMLAMKLQYIQEDVKTETGEFVKDVVITVPHFFDQYQRQAIVDAAQIAGIKILALVNDGSAVALNYAMTRKFTDTPQHHIIYDMGSGSTAATVVAFQEVTALEGKYRRNVTFTQVEVKGVGYDKELGGMSFDSRIQKLLEEKFLEKNPKLKEALNESPRALLKLQKEATRIKQILSANNDAYCSIESLVEDTDIKTGVTRVDFESKASDLFTRTLNPIHDALAKAKLTINDIDSIILFGGGVRVPKVLNTLKDFAGADKISQNVNGDEAASLGASFRGAALSSQFKVKDIRLKDRVLYGLELLVSNEGEEKQAHKFTLFEPNSVVVEGRYLPVKLTTDFDFQVQYAEATSPVGPNECPVLGVGKVRGVAEASAKFGDRILESPKLRLLVSMNPSGIVSIVKAQAVYQLKPVEVPEDKEKDANDTAKEKPVVEKKKQVTEKVSLELTYEQTCFPPMSKTQKEEATQRLNDLNKLDKERYARDEARNLLESFVYSVSDYLDRDEVKTVTSETERKTLLDASSTASEWLSEHAEDASKDELDAQLKPLDKMKKPIINRLKEFQTRPAAIKALRATLSEVESYITSMTQTVTEANKEILAPTLKKIRDGAIEQLSWIDGREQDLSKLKPYDEPTVTVKQIERRQKEFDGLKFTLMREILALPLPPKEEKKKDEKKDEKKDDTQSESASETTASESEVPPTSSSSADEKDEL